MVVVHQTWGYVGILFQISPPEASSEPGCHGGPQPNQQQTDRLNNATDAT